MSELKSLTDIPYPQVTDIRLEYFGDEMSRVEALSPMDYDTFKRTLIDIHDSHPNIQQEGRFVTRQNGTNGGEYYSVADDKDGLMEYALNQAKTQDDIQVAALLLGVAVVAIHPFGDGNGRTARTLYSQLSRGFSDNDPEHEKLRYNNTRGRGLGSDLVSFASVSEDMYGLADKAVYMNTEVAKIATQDWYLSNDPEAAKKHYGDREYHGLTYTEREKLDGLLGYKHGKDGEEGLGRYAATSGAIVFGFSKIEAAHHVNLPIKEFPGNRRAIITPDALTMMSGDMKREFTGYMQEYHSEKARAAIDLIGKYGDTYLNLAGSGKIKVRDYLLTQTRTYLASSLHNR